MHLAGMGERREEGPVLCVKCASIGSGKVLPCVCENDDEIAEHVWISHDSHSNHI